MQEQYNVVCCDCDIQVHFAFLSQVLLVSSSRCQNLWVVPGGGLEPGEEPEATAVREVNEEVIISLI